MTGPASRRSFLRGLTTLPLVGGGVALLGSPTAVAEPCTPLMLERYADWLAVEYGESLIELGAMRERDPVRAAVVSAWRREWCRDNLTLTGGSVERFAEPPAVLPSARAALVLSTVDSDWREGAR